MPKNAPLPKRAAKVRVRIKGSGTEGHLYEGTRMIQRCSNCPPSGNVGEP